MNQGMMLKVVGYWYDGFELWLPDPSVFVDPSWEIRDRDRIVGYLRSGVRIREYLGFSWCRFEGGPPEDQMGNADLSDGTWVWPEGLSIYVSQFSVTLPDDFVAHMRANDFRVPPNLDADALGNASDDPGYWRDWCNKNYRPDDIT